MFEKLRGQFAVALWDGRQQRLVLGRDRFGICPLYWTRPGRLAAVRLRDQGAARLGNGGRPARPARHQPPVHLLRPAGAGDLLRGRPAAAAGPLPAHPDGRPRPVGPGQRAHLLGDRLSRPRPGRPGDDEKRLVDGFEQVLLGAVERRLRADVPVVSYLSGGVDSSMVVALASHVRGSPIPTFTISVAGPEARTRRTRPSSSPGTSAPSRSSCRSARDEALDHLPGADPRRRGAGRRHVVCRPAAAGARGPRPRLQGDADRRGGRRVAGRLSVVQGRSRCSARSTSSACRCRSGCGAAS